MKEDFQVIFKKWKNKDLITWIEDYENKYYSIDSKDNEIKKEILEQVHNNNKNVRKLFFDNYLSDISNNLNSKSNKDNYQYDYTGNQTISQPSKLSV